MGRVCIAGHIYPDPLYESNWGHKIAEFNLPFTLFVIAFMASEYIKRYWETICGQSI